jgi:hypothetical protein
VGKSANKVSTARNDAHSFTKLFLVVYMLVMGADWLQVRVKLHPSFVRSILNDKYA